MAGLKIKSGQRYVTRGGEVTTPLVHEPGDNFPFTACVEDMQLSWTEEGFWFAPNDTNMDDLVAEYVAPNVVEIVHISGTDSTPDTANPKDLLGIKKPPLDLIPAAAELHESMAMANGAGKYGPYNWRGKQVRASIYIAAALRHLKSWQDGEQVASDSGVHHLGHARACLGILLDAEATGNLIDDRPPAGAASRLIAEMTKA